eukprot:3928306-Amphidinium_carterae.1
MGAASTQQVPRLYRPFGDGIVTSAGRQGGSMERCKADFQEPCHPNRPGVDMHQVFCGRLCQTRRPQPQGWRGRRQDRSRKPPAPQDTPALKPSSPQDKDAAATETPGEAKAKLKTKIQALQDLIAQVGEASPLHADLSSQLT